MRKVGTLGVFLSLLSGCGASEGNEPNANSGGQGGQAGGDTPMAGSAGSIIVPENEGGAGGTPFIDNPNDPCVDDEWIDFRVSSSLLYGDEHQAIRARGYVLDFERGRVAAEVDLTLEGSEDWTGRVSPADLDPPATCGALIGYATFETVEYDDGYFGSNNLSPSAMAVGAGAGPCDWEFDVDTVPADQVRLWGVRPGQAELDGPIVFDGDSETHWLGATNAAFKTACEETPGYVLVITAHRGEELVGLYTEPGDFL